MKDHLLQFLKAWQPPEFMAHVASTPDYPLALGARPAEKAAGLVFTCASRPLKALLPYLYFALLALGGYAAVMLSPAIAKRWPF